MTQEELESLIEYSGTSGVLLLIAELQSQLVAANARAVPALTWIRENGESAADHGYFALEVARSYRHASALRWRVYVSVDVVAEGPAESQADGEAKAEAALLAACGVKS